MKEPVEPMSPDLQALLEVERPGVPPSPQSADRILGALKASLPAKTFQPAQPSQPATPVHSGVLSGLARKLPLHLLTFGLGAAAGAGTVASLRHPPPPPAPVIATAPAPVPPPVAVAPVQPPPVVAPPRPIPRPPPHAVAVERIQEAPARHDQDLAAERALVEQARTAFTRGDSAGALAAADEHRMRFPEGSLAEERDALRIQALADLGRMPEARAAASAFHARYPRSLLAPVVDDAIKGQP